MVSLFTSLFPTVSFLAMYLNNINDLFPYSILSYNTLLKPWKVKQNVLLYPDLYSRLFAAKLEMQPGSHCTVLYCTVLYCIVLYCTVLYYIVLYCSVLHCKILYSRLSSLSYHALWDWMTGHITRPVTQHSLCHPHLYLFISVSSSLSPQFYLLTPNSQPPHKLLTLILTPQSSLPTSHSQPQHPHLPILILQFPFLSLYYKILTHKDSLLYPHTIVLTRSSILASLPKTHSSLHSNKYPTW